MTRQCAWCDRYLSLDTSEPFITHGICECCAEQVRDSFRKSPAVSDILEEMLLTQQATGREMVPLC